MVFTNASLLDHAILDEYCRIYENTQGSQADVYYLGYGWYLVNGEMCHTLFLLDETKRLQRVMERQLHLERQKLRLLRLIRRLRGL